MKEPANINTTTVQPTPTATVYGMPAYADRAAAEPLRSLHGSWRGPSSLVRQMLPASRGIDRRHTVFKCMISLPRNHALVSILGKHVIKIIQRKAPVRHVIAMTIKLL